MKDMVKRTFDAATAWQQGVAWIRINVAFIEAELPVAAKPGDDVADIKRVVAQFAPAFARFCDAEYRLFVQARQVAADAAPLRKFMDQLLVLREAFRPWTMQVHQAVQGRRSKDEAGHSLGCTLLLCCGGEIHQAHTAFIDAIDDFAGQLEPRKQGGQAG